MKVFGVDQNGNIKGIVYIDKPKHERPKDLPDYIKISVTQNDIDRSYQLKKDNPPSQCIPFAQTLIELGINSLTLSHDWGVHEEDIIQWIQSWDRGEKISPRDFIIKTTSANPMAVCILNPGYEQN